VGKEAPRPPDRPPDLADTVTHIHPHTYTIPDTCPISHSDAIAQEMGPRPQDRPPDLIPLDAMISNVESIPLLQMYPDIHAILHLTTRR